MRFNKIALRNFAILLLLMLSFIACNDDFTTIDSDIINEDTATDFNATSEKYEVISYTDVLEPVQTNGLGLYQLGVYNDPTYGQTVASVLTQVTPGSIDPTFGETGSDDDIVLESVVLTIPFFSTRTSISEDGIEYELDSVLPRGDEYSPIKLSMFENNYFLRDFDPSGDFDIDQSYFSNKSASSNDLISISSLETTTIAVINELEISPEEIVITEETEDGETTTERLSPRIREVWHNDNIDDIEIIQYWKEKIIDQENLATLSSTDNFNDYFRGIYFKAEQTDSDDAGSLMLLNLAQAEANITLNYSFTPADGDSGRENGSYTLTFGETRVNFFENNFNSTFPTQNGDDVNGDENLYLKGGEGSSATIKLFNGENTDDDDTTDNTFEAWRKEFVNVDEDGQFVSSKRLVNEANLIFYVDQDLVETRSDGESEEPDRLYLYNKTDGTFLIDYTQDTQNNSLPQFSIANHLGILVREETPDIGRGKGIRYKMRITSHINNLLLNNTENVELGLAVSGNVNLESTVPQYIIQNNGTEDETTPVSSIITPRGTVLHGNASSDSSKRLILEIFYTEPN